MKVAGGQVALERTNAPGDAETYGMFIFVCTESDSTLYPSYWTPREPVGGWPTMHPTISHDEAVSQFQEAGLSAEDAEIAARAMCMLWGSPPEGGGKDSEITLAQTPVWAELWIPPSPATNPPIVSWAGIQIDRIRFDPPGSDGSNASLNKEYLVIENTGLKAIQLVGMTIRDADRHVYRLPLLWLDVGKKVFLHTGRGRDSGEHLYWGLDEFVWDDDGDRAKLMEDTGYRLIDNCSYSGGGSAQTC